MKTQEELEREFKECPKCKIYKRFSEYHHKSNGLGFYCKECHNEMNRKSHRKNNKDPEHYFNRLNRMTLSDAERKSNPLYVKTKRNTNPNKRYQRDNPEKCRAYNKVSYNLKRGYIIKEPCAICGELNVQAHHEDYSKPLDVVWLCKAHHMEIHRKFNTIRQQLGLPEHDRQL